MRWIVPFLIAIAPASALAAQSFNYGSDDGLSYVLLADGNGSTMISGNTDDFRRAEALRAGDGPLLYVRQDGVGYVIRDAAFLRRAQAIVRPQQELGERQGELGKQQGELGRRQGELGREQGRLGSMMANSSARRMGELGRQQAALGRQQAALGTEQAALGRKQAALGREQARLAKLAQPQFRALVADAIRSGAAQRVN